MGGPSGPTLSDPGYESSGDKSVGPEGPPTTARESASASPPNPGWPPLQGRRPRRPRSPPVLRPACARRETADRANPTPAHRPPAPPVDPDRLESSGIAPNPPESAPPP
ncbi:DUF6053 domain-containing protein [Lysobacter enzymogenes]|uniref:DUF6053 domain-containing protein n=1 Tax=Lysobacter enzymogenes TaxID=69 RepID=UPI003D18EC6B